MTQGANVPAREAVSQILLETVRLGLRPRPGTLRCRAARLYKRIYDSLVLCLKIKELHRRRIALDTAITLFVGHAAARHHEPDPTDRCLTVSTSGSRASFTSRAPALRCADVCGFGPVPAQLPRALPYDQHTQKMGNGVP